MRSKAIQLLIALVWMTGCQAPEYPEFLRMEKIRLSSFSDADGWKVSFVGDAVFNNPNAFGANVKGLNFDVYIDGEYLTHVEQDVEVRVLKSSNFTLPLKFTVPVSDILDKGSPGLLKILKVRKVPYRLDGHVRISFGATEIEIPVDYSNEEPLNIVLP